MSSAKSLITDKSEEVYTILYEALDRLIINRINDGAFTDQEDVSAKAYFSTLEGLEALLIPFVTLPKILWDSLRLRHKELPEIISGDISFVLSHNSNEDTPPKEQGAPYFEQGKGVRQTPYWTSECASFTLSVLTNYLKLCEKVGLAQLPMPKIIKAIKTNLRWIELCKRDIGWSWTNDSPSHPWPTWSVLDTFEEMLNYDSLKDLHASLDNASSPILGKIIESFKTDVVGSYLSDWEEKVVNSEPYSVEDALDLSRLMLAVSLHSNRKIVKPLAYKLFAWASESDFGNLDYYHHLQPKSDIIADSSLVPSVLRTLIFMAGVLKPKGISDLDKEIEQNHEVVLNRVYLHLMKNQINQGKFRDLWGVSSDGLKYELYYTERTVEALTEFLDHYEPNSTAILPFSSEVSEAIPAISKPVQEEGAFLKKVVVPQVGPAYLPILDELARQRRKDLGADIFNDVLVIYVLHFLKDLITFIDQFQSAGCDPKDMYFLVKTYDYPEKGKLVEYFQDKGCKVFVPKDSMEKTFNNMTAEILMECMKRSKSENKKVVIVEDGGYFAPLIHTEKFIETTDRCYGVVEQTTKGYRRDFEIKNPKFPIVSIATSKLKIFLEAQEVAATLEENIVNTLRKYNSDRTLNNHKALILGYGTIGQKLADALFNKKISISVYDTDPFKRLSAELNKFNVLENLDDLSKFHIIIGVSGEPSLKDATAFWGLEHNVILASGSSERLEFDLEALVAISKGISREEVFTKYILKKDSKVIRVLCDGEPINFALSEGIAKSVIDPIYAEMFLAAISVLKDKGLENGLQELPRKTELEVLSIFKSYQGR
jgi:adenosylhomocysteinase